MAKKNSSKTATEKSISNSEPRLLQVKGWTGIDLRNVPNGWTPGERGWDGEGYKGDSKFNQTDEKVTYLLLQNNVVTTPEMTLQTRDQIKQVTEDLPEHVALTGVCCLCRNRLFLGAYLDEYEYVEPSHSGGGPVDEIPTSEHTVTMSGYGIAMYDLGEGFVDFVRIDDAEEESGFGLVFPSGNQATEIGYFESKLLVLTSNYEAYLLDLAIDENGKTIIAGDELLSSSPYVPDPIGRGNMTFSAHGFIADELGPMNMSSHWDAERGFPFYRDGDELVEFHSPGYTAYGYDDMRFLVMDEGTGEVNMYHGASEGGSTVNWDPNPVDTIGTRIQFFFSFTNRFGTTIGTEDAVVVYSDLQPLLWSPSQYLEIEVKYKSGYGIDGVDIYASLNEAITPVFIGHIDVDPSVESEELLTATYMWHGGLDDASQWTNVPLDLPQENTTKGAPCRHFSIIDSRLYFWDSMITNKEYEPIDPDDESFNAWDSRVPVSETSEKAPWRLYIGGNPGSEFSIARGLGGAWVDIEPGSGIVINGVAKWKTVSGASIVTILCGNVNTNKVKRFNLLETTISITNEISQHGYMYEEVPNVVGCNSRWGYGVFQDGLYAVSRYGLMVTTMAMEYNSQMRAQKVSGNIDPVFTSRLGKRIDDARLVHIDGTIFIVLAEDRGESDSSVALDHAVLCYEVDEKAWYTVTLDIKEKILHIFPMDYEGYPEGLGIITEDNVYLYPTTDLEVSIEDEDAIQTRSLPYTIVETHEIAGSTPVQGMLYTQQLEFRFDWFEGDLDVVVEGVDYYGRYFHIYKKIKHRDMQRNLVEWIRVEKYVEYFRILMKGRANYRCTHWLARVYSQSKRINNVYGYDAKSWYTNRSGGRTFDHHYIKDYNDLKRAIVP